MACKNTCQLCKKFVLSQSIIFADGNVVINLPEGSYNNHQRYCVVFAQQIPANATIGANVVFTIGTGTEQYPLVSKCCKNITACGIRTRTRYALVVETNATGAVFKMVGTPSCQPNNDLPSVNGTAPTVPVVPSPTGGDA